MYIPKKQRRFYPGYYQGRLIPHGPFLEEWRPVIGFENYYIISNYGNLKSLDISVKCKHGKGHRIKLGRTMKKETTNMDYIRYSLNKYNLKKRMGGHRLVAIHFIKNIKNKSCVNHIRGFTKDNLFTQLEWVTYSENEKHSFSVLGKVAHNKGVRSPRHDSKKVIGVHIITGHVIKLDYPQLADEHGFLSEKVRMCCLGKRLTHKNYKWNYEIK